MYNIWLVWLAVMGANLARNIANKWFKILTYNRTPSKTQEFIEQYWNENLWWAMNIKEFVTWLETPRKIILMVKAWDAVDEIIEQILPYLEKDDILIDWWNSYYKDTVKRWKYLNSKWIKFIWTWVSGGEEWALHWPSIMPGWDHWDWLLLKPILEKICAKDFDGWPCVAYIWENWAWHYVKMVHNGIEYAIMQMMAEGYDSLRLIYGLSAWQIWEIFKKYNDWKLNSYLFEISIAVLSQKDDINQWKYLVDFILDKAWNKWTWKWTAMDALDRWVAVPSITEAVYARYISAQKDLRVDISKKYTPASYEKIMPLDEYIKLLEDGLYLWMLSAYAQWYDLISNTAKQENWTINLAHISRIWEWGCIIRAKILKILHNAFEKAWNKIHLFQIPSMVEIFEKDIENYKLLVSIFSKLWVSSLALSSGLSYFISMKSEKVSANFLQWQRDYFWAHTYERTDKEGIFHTNWN